MRTVKLLLLASLLLLGAALPAAAQLNDTYVIPAAANVGGAFGTRWLTQFSVFNPHLDYSLDVSITFVPTGGGQGVEEVVRIPPNAVAYSDDILGDLFALGGTGSLLVAVFPEDNPGVPDDAISRAVLVTTNTYNNSRNGTFGQTIAGTWTGLLDYDTDGITGIAHGIRNISSLGWRTNVGAVNLGRCSVDMFVSVYNADGATVLDNARFQLPPLGHMQDLLPVQVDRGTVEFWVDDPCASDSQRYAVVFPYVSTIDQLSGDPTYQAATLLASPGSLFAKKGNVDPTSLGKKIDTSYLRGARATAKRLGYAKLTKGASGLRISK
ncbi:MAG TPA: hypothetical protein VFN10_10060 [Thermoanaerobaculia bacterium]|nr:hypothetical protein [Thermoanaerobaculia bacterium]